METVAWFTVIIAANTFQAWYSDNEAERDFLVSVATGPNWFQLFVPFFNYSILPLLLWFRKPRRSSYASFIIVFIWILSYIWVDFLTHQKMGAHVFRNEYDWQEYASKGVVFAVTFMLGWLFFFVRSRKKTGSG